MKHATVRTREPWLRHLTAVALALVPSGQAAAHASGASAPLVHIRLLALNDLHGQLGAGRLVGSRTAGGAPVLAAWLRASGLGDTGTLLLHAGDLAGASPAESALLQDEPIVGVMNLLANRWCSADDRSEPRCDIVGTVGNHDLDEGRDELLRLVLGGNHRDCPFLDDPWEGARFPTVCCNVVDAATGRTILPAHVVRTVAGRRVGIIGAVLRGTPGIVLPAGVAGLRFLDEADAVNASAAELARQGVRAIVLIIHQGGRQLPYVGPTRDDAPPVEGAIAPIVARLDEAVDVVVSGHLHSFSNGRLPDRAGRLVLVTQAWSSATAFADIDLALDPVTGDVVSSSARIVTAWADEGPGLHPDPAVARLCARAHARVANVVDRMVASVASDVTREQDEAGESALGDLVADAQRAATGAEVALMHPGGLRSDLRAGPVTWGDLFAVQPFGNTLVTFEITGARLLAVLEGQGLGTPEARNLQVSGMSYTWDPSAPEQHRVVAVTVGGVPLDPARRLRLTVNDFLAQGGDRFSGLEAGAERKDGGTALDALVGYLQALPSPAVLARDGRIGLAAGAR